MTEVFEWTITELLHEADGSDVEVVAGGGEYPTEFEARSEMERYAMQYAQDGPIEVQLFKVTREELVCYRVVPSR
jgi:hypothetical protein